MNSVGGNRTSCLRPLLAITSMALILCAVASPSAAQGVRAGLSFSNLSVPDNLETRQGFVFGASFSFLNFGILSLSPEILYVQRGARRPTPSEEAGLEDVRIDWFEIPLLVRAGGYLRGTPIRPSLHAGPYFAFRTSCSFGGDAGSRTDGCLFPAMLDFGIDGSFNDQVLGWVVGAGVDVLVPSIGTLLLEARYSASFTDIMVNGSNDLPKSSSFIIMGGWAPGFR